MVRAPEPVSKMFVKSKAFAVRTREAEKGFGAMSNTHRKPRSINWAGISDSYFKTDHSLRSIAREFGVTEAAIRKHATQHGWVRPDKVAGAEDIGRLASSLALAMISIDGVSNRAKRFVAAMVKLDARPVDIADGLEISEDALRAEFANEMRGG
jgi:hypothetical protein